MLTPLTLLGDFVTQVGKAPEKETLTTYFARLREQVALPSLSAAQRTALSLLHVPSTAKVDALGQPIDGKGPLTDLKHQRPEVKCYHVIAL